MAWSVLQSASTAATGNSGTQSATFTTANLSSGTKLIAAVACSANGLTVSSVKDGAGNSFTSLATVSFNNAASNGQLSLWAIDTPAGDAGTKPTITATLTASTTETSLLIQEVSGLLAGNTAAMLDGTAGS